MVFKHPLIGPNMGHRRRGESGDRARHMVNPETGDQSQPGRPPSQGDPESGGVILGLVKLASDVSEVNKHFINL